MSRKARANIAAITHGKEPGPKLVPQRIPLTKTEQMAVKQLLLEQQALEQNRQGVIMEIAARCGLAAEQIGTEYALFTDALVKQPQKAEPPNANV
jgi:hypothetical protein